MNRKLLRFVWVAIASGCAAGAGAHTASGSAPRHFDPSKVESTPFGQEGDPRKVTRTIRVSMSDRMRFEPADVTVKRGETVRFVITNGGALPHEMVLGTPGDLAKHAALMKRFPGMVHDEPSIAHVKPGARGEIVWQFTQAGRFEFACLEPGHFDAGMVGSLIVR